jgi:hypothetical protein
MPMPAATTEVSSPESPYHHSLSIACTPPSALASVPITILLPSSTHFASIEPHPFVAFVAPTWASASAEDGE